MDSRPIRSSSFLSRMERELANTSGDMTIDLIERREHTRLNPWQKEVIRKTIDSDDKVISVHSGRRSGKTYLAKLMDVYINNTSLIIPRHSVGSEYYPNHRTYVYRSDSFRGYQFDTIICDDLEPTEAIVEHLTSRASKVVFISSYRLTPWITIINKYKTVEETIKDWDD